MPSATASAALSALGIAPDITESERGSYLNQIAKHEQQPDGSFQPTSSDLLVREAEQRFRDGRKAYKLKDSDAARSAFDAAVDLMLNASDNPTDRQLYEAKLEEMVDSIHRYDLAGLGASAQVNEPQFEKAPLENILQMTFPVDPKLKSKVSGEVIATSSQLPLAVNDTVLGFINYFSGRGRRTMIVGLERAGKYRPMIKRILEEEGVPQELIHLAQAESGFMPRAVSRMAATGMWQFMSWRGNEYGLKQTHLADDRLDPEKATRAAAKHLHDLYNHFGDWYLAIAAYNCGPGNVEKAIERTGYADFWELRNRRALPAETTSYVPIILAMTIMTKNAAEYGLDNITLEPPIEYDTIEVSAPTNLALIGDLTETPISQLTQLNPALLRNVAPEGYSVRVPKGTGEALTTAIESVPANRRASWRMHRVESGETLAAIAKRFNSATGSIAAANKLAADEPVAGDRLVIPASFQDEEDAPRIHSRSWHPSRQNAGKSRAKVTRTAVHSSGRRAGTRARGGSGLKRAAFPQSSGKLARVNRHRNSLDR
ncbi:MAG: transglycosylase SLT domain-containing protein [Acidobacteriota bacterium]|nr:transglycosylase SLT domain-containing protein [Acidobacteriota bacterium]